MIFPKTFFPFIDGTQPMIILHFNHHIQLILTRFAALFQLEFMLSFNQMVLLMFIEVVS